MCASFGVWERSVSICKLLSNRFPGQSRNYFHALISSNSVLVDGVPIMKKSVKLREGTSIEVIFTEPTDRSTIVPNDIPLDVIYEDEHVLAINKAPGMVVHPAPGQ